MRGSVGCNALDMVSVMYPAAPRQGEYTLQPGVDVDKLESGTPKRLTFSLFSCRLCPEVVFRRFLTRRSDGRAKAFRRWRST
jgi:hypothetical protein